MRLCKYCLLLLNTISKRVYCSLYANANSLISIAVVRNEPYSTCHFIVSNTTIFDVLDKFNPISHHIYKDSKYPTKCIEQKSVTI